MPSVYRPLVNFVATAMQAVLNLALLCLGSSWWFFWKETFHLAHVLFTPEPVSKYKLVEGLVVYFLYFEFIALIVKYFESGFHFPLRYFVYIGITAIVRPDYCRSRIADGGAYLFGSDPDSGDYAVAV